MAPVTKFQTMGNYVPWMSKDTKSLKNQRENLSKTATDTDHPDDWRQYRAMRNRVTSKLRQDKQKWEKEKLEVEKNDSTGVWKTVKG